MSTNVTLSDSLPKDSSGQRFLALVNDQTSQLDFTLWKGIGSSTISSRVMGYAGVANAVQASKIESLHPLVVIGAPMIDPSATPASPVLSGRAKIGQMSQFGELLSTPHPRIVATMTSGSKNTIKAGSGIVYSFGVSFSGVSLGEVFTLSDDTAFRAAIIATSTVGHADRIIPDGGWLFSASITLQRTLGGAASLVVSYL